MPKDAAFWQFLYLLFAKMYDERVSRRVRRAPEFHALPAEPFNDDGRKAIRKWIEALFAEVKKEYPLFTARDEENTRGLPGTEEQLISHQDRLHAYADKHLFGADFDPFLVRATSMSIMTLTGGEGNVYNMDSLAFPGGHLPGVGEAGERLRLGKVVDVLMTNPPFGTDIKIEDQDVLRQYAGHDGVANSWSRNKQTGIPEPGPNPVAAVAPEQLFIQRAVQWVKPGGRIGIVLPNGILSNPGPTDEAIRRWILDNCWVLASVELPVETFIYDAGVNILTSLLFLKKKTENEKIAATMAGEQPDYPVFMAVAEKVGIDRRGNPVYKRHPDGEIVLEVQEEKERVRIGGREEVTVLHRKHKAIDNDLPEIAKAYKRFRERHPEPGLPPGDRPLIPDRGVRVSLLPPANPQLQRIMKAHRKDLRLEVIRDGVERSALSDNLKQLAQQRLDLAADYIDDSAKVKQLVRPGRMIIVDLRDEYIEKDEALGLFVVLMQLFAESQHEGRRFNKLVVFDEAHKYIESPDLVAGLVESVREMRHKGMSVLVASQDPPSVPISLIELSNHVILHKFTSPAWLKHLQKANASLAELTSAKMAGLLPGEAYVWSSQATDSAFTNGVVKVHLRPRVTRHGGGTKTATE
jgi:type I restriction-modification system DNA methylase subunit